MQFLDGAYARGELLDHVSPAVAFTWCSDEPALASVADLEGKVVVLDFWATWCGPCIASFPSVRELQKHYDGYDVAIVGVTSRQGKHYPGDGPPVDTEGDADKEHELMKEFVVSKDMTWTVAFSEADVFNPDYGVRGIPHVAILDAEGKVRYNGLHPSSPLSEKTAKIDALLKEAGLPAPPSPGGADSDSDEHAGHGHDEDEGHDED
jgi:thiol-disulfide isomerase/thioredoxin